MLIHARMSIPPTGQATGRIYCGRFTVARDTDDPESVMNQIEDWFIRERPMLGYTLEQKYPERTPTYRIRLVIEQEADV